MKILLKKMRLTNFKGIRNFEINFDEEINEVRGANGTGKTSLFDAFLWLLFGKDSRGKKDFGIKTYDENGEEIHRIEHNVTAVISVDGVDKVLSRTLREKWQTERGKTEEVYKGNETIYEIDNVPLKMSEYTKRISDWIDEDFFKLITNPAEFVSLKTPKQREILMNMAGLGDDMSIATEYGKEAIIAILNSGKSIVDRAKELAKTKSKLRKEMELIPARIDELNRSLNTDVRTVEVINGDITAIKADIDRVTANIERLKSDGGTSKVRAAEAALEQAKAEYQAKAYKLKAENDKIIFEHKQQIEAVEREIQAAEKNIRGINNDISFSKQQTEKLRAEYVEVRKTEYPAFDDNVCPCCGRPWEAATLAEKRAEYEEKRKTYNADRAKRLAGINEKGAKYAQLVKDCETKIDEKQAELGKLKEKLANLNVILPTLEQTMIQPFDATEYIQDIEAAKQEAGSNVVDTAELDVLKERLAALETEKAETTAVAKTDVRIKELEADIKAKAQAIADIEREEAVIEDFTRLKIDVLDKAVNDKFKLVKFKLYDHQINGGFTECCTPTISGVPYDDLNGSSKINAGLDIVNTLQQFYGVQVPVFIDNKERVTAPLKLDCQTIYLSVWDDKEAVEDIKVIDINKKGVA